jgi:hypothetical protein
MPVALNGIFPFSEDRLSEYLSNKFCTKVEVAKRPLPQYLFRYLSAIDAHTMIVEQPYIDADYLDDFSSFYVKCFNDYERHCKRLHFFSIDLTEEKFMTIIRGEADSKDVEEFANAYLGFIVARPLPDAIVGRTILKTYPSDGKRRNYDCTKKYVTNLFGTELVVRSLPFQEQDTVLSACATVALWCCFHKATELFNTPSPTPAVITRAANRVLNARPIPSHGLDVEQICNAISHIGLEPEIFEVNSATPLVSLIYGHLKMGLPVLLGIAIEGVGLHAITINGYSILKQEHLKQEVSANDKSIPMTGLRINEFYAHDDQIGPFSRILVQPSTTLHKTYPVTFEGAWTEQKTGKVLRMYPEVVIVPVYHKIRLTFIDVQLLLTRLHNVVVSFLSTLNLKLEWDISLLRSNDYKVMAKNERSISAERLATLLMEPHPRFIWQAVLQKDDRKALELLIDATDMARSFPVYQLIWHDSTMRAIVAKVLEAPSLQSVLSEMLSEPFLAFMKDHTSP